MRRRLTVLVVAVCLAGPPGASAAGSADVAALQVALRAHSNYGGTVDGVLGPQTRAGVRRFERRARLPVDGVAGPRVLRRLGRLGRHPLGSRPMRLGDVGWDVAALQFRLAWHGFPSGNFDGGFGAHVQAAVELFQRWAGLPADGVAGPATLSSLRRHRIPTSPLRLGWPLSAPLGDGFGPRGDRFHPGIDLEADMGRAVHAAGSGRVVFAGFDPGGYGNLVVIRHARGVTSWYAHLSRIAVRRGRHVRAGALVGRVGATGNATGPHLHFEVRVRDAAVNPLTALR
ncbi:MAG: peptidoglycan DD-metalloendopeptidase family protein [Thermoleophilaceae bacterium]